MQHNIPSEMELILIIDAVSVLFDSSVLAVAVCGGDDVDDILSMTVPSTFSAEDTVSQSSSAGSG